MTASYSDRCNIKTCNNFCFIWNCRLFLTCLSMLTKPPLVFQFNVRMCFFVTSTVAKEVTAPDSSSHVSTNKVHDCSHSWLLPSQLDICILVQVTSLNAIWSLFWQWYRPQTDIFWNIKFFLLEELWFLLLAVPSPLCILELSRSIHIDMAVKNTTIFM